MTLSEANDWLDSCAAIFVGEGGYVRLPGGGYEYEPAPLREQVPTTTLVQLLHTADAMNEDEDLSHIPSTDDHYRTLLFHLHNRAIAGDPTATAALETRMTGILNQTL